MLKKINGIIDFIFLCGIVALIVWCIFSSLHPTKPTGAKIIECAPDSHSEECDEVRLAADSDECDAISLGVGPPEMAKLPYFDWLSQSIAMHENMSWNQKIATEEKYEACMKERGHKP
jgi:hypothetical protein